MMRLALGLVLVSVGCSVPGKVFSGGDSPGSDAGLLPDAMQPDGPPGDTTPPDTSITMMPPGLDNSTTVTFAFTSTESGSTFECAMDTDAFAPCPTPPRFANLVGGLHTFKV